ncbi:glycosyltransferase [Blastopirellula sp. J2-11]|uniref:glycosyltransferase n=1 Tax=Blastopirellula sp. J2-11 TaxID=2943192 RepID=UPI0021C64577|nr:glycosyltransferase [Blastopirellula sp. J2-11]UUO06175.1 glycosyltransferase [Blastopirellula sp. J2-11]
MKLSLLIPVFNEAPFLRAFWRNLQSAPIDYCEGITTVEIILVDDGSTDRTREILGELTSQDFAFNCGMQAEVVLLEQGMNQGKGRAVQRAISASTGDIILVQDADLEYVPSDYPKLLQPIMEKKADAVFGSRFAGYPRRVLYFWHSLVNQLLTSLSNIILDVNLTDMETCYKAMRGDLARSLRLTSPRFGIEPEITSRLVRAKARLYEVPIQYHGRTYAEGKKIGVNDGIAALWHILYYGLFDREPFRSGLDQSLNSLDSVVKYLYEPVLRKALRSISYPKGDCKILEIGAGIGSLTGMLVSEGDVVACDINPDYVDRLRARFRNRDNVEFAEWDATQPPPGHWPKFDVIVAVNVLEHIEDDQKTLEHWRSLLSDDGSLIVLVPNYPSLFSPIDEAVGHYRRYTKQILHNKMADAKLAPVRSYFCNAVGILGWLVNGVWFKRSHLPSGQLWIYAMLKFAIAPIEAFLHIFTGLSVIWVARRSAVKGSPEVLINSPHLPYAPTQALSQSRE